jgi:NTE family protein
MGAWVVAIVLLVLVVSFAVADLPARDEDGAATQTTRPKIGLVLSGGGARGSAHVGVIKVMEELRIPVDYVVGTSMGSIVGGLYASGLSPGEIEEGFRTIDWGTAFNDKPDRKRIAFRRKEDDFQALLPFEWGVGRGGFSTRSGIINGQKINLILRGMVIHTVDVDDFDDLRLPYRALAADLQTGDAVVLGRGDLALAMRASMSVPGVFTPVKIEDHVLIDGGIAMNLPVQVAQQMGAARIIAVDVGTPPSGDAESLSALGVVSHTFSVLAKRNVGEQMKLLSEGDLLIVPDLEEISSSDFDKLLLGVSIGEQAARSVENELRGFSVSEREFADYLVRQRTIPKEQREIVTADRVEVTGLTLTKPEFITRRLKSRPGEPLQSEAINKDLERIQQLGEFETVDVRVEEEDGTTTLSFDAREKSWGPGYLRLGIGVESNFDGDSDFRAIVNYRRVGINRRGGEWKTVASIGDPFSVVTELFQPLDLGGIQSFVAPSFRFTKDKGERFLPGGSFEVVESDMASAGLDLGVQFRNWGEIRIGARRGTFDGEVTTLSTIPDFDIELGGWKVKATLDQLDNVFFPRRGSFVELNGFFSRDHVGADFDYDKVSLRTLNAWGGRHDTLIGGLEYGTDLGSDIPFHDEFELGGFLNVSGLTRGELQGDVKALATLGYYRQVTELGALGRGFYVGAFAQSGNVWTDVEEIELGDLVYSGTIFAGLDTLLAPVYLGWGLADGGRDEFYLFIGRPFE